MTSLYSTLSLSANVKMAIFFIVESSDALVRNGTRSSLPGRNVTKVFLVFRRRWKVTQPQCTDQESSPINSDYRLLVIYRFNQAYQFLLYFHSAKNFQFSPWINFPPKLFENSGKSTKLISRSLISNSTGWPASHSVLIHLSHNGQVTQPAQPTLKIPTNQTVFPK